MTRVSGTSRALNESPDGNDEDNEDERCFPPKMCGDRFTISFPLSVPAYCFVGKCHLGIVGKTWTTVVSNLKRHLKEIHMVIPRTKVIWCSLCQTDLDRQVATHACFKQRPLLVKSNEALPYPCNQCSRSFSTWRGLSGHKQAHKKNDVQNAYNKRNNLPVAGPSTAASDVVQVDAELGALGVEVTDDDVDMLVGILANEDQSTSSYVNIHDHNVSSVFNISNDIFNSTYNQDAGFQLAFARPGPSACNNYTGVVVPAFFLV